VLPALNEDVRILRDGKVVWKTHAGDVSAPRALEEGAHSPTANRAYYHPSSSLRWEWVALERGPPLGPSTRGNVKHVSCQYCLSDA
jgi:hypothetical protein